jgi:hypothetical protein
MVTTLTEMEQSMNISLTEIVNTFGVTQMVMVMKNV